MLFYLYKDSAKYCKELQRKNVNVTLIALIINVILNFTEFGCLQAVIIVTVVTEFYIYQSGNSKKIKTGTLRFGYIQLAEYFLQY